MISSKQSLVYSVMKSKSFWHLLKWKWNHMFVFGFSNRGQSTNESAKFYEPSVVNFHATERCLTEGGLIMPDLHTMN